MGAKRVLYFSGGRLPLAFLAGALHTGLLAPGRPKEAALLGLSFAGSGQSCEGRFFHLGENGGLCQVFALWVNGERGMVPRLVASFLEIYGIEPAELLLVDCGAKGGWLVAAGFFFWRRRLLSGLGKRLLGNSLRGHLRRLEHLVAGVKSGRQP